VPDPSGRHGPRSVPHHHRTTGRHPGSSAQPAEPHLRARLRSLPDRVRGRTGNGAHRRPATSADSARRGTRLNCLRALELQALLHVVSSFDLPPAPRRRLEGPMSRRGASSAGGRENEGGTGDYRWRARLGTRASSPSRRVLRWSRSGGAERARAGAVNSSVGAVTMPDGAVAWSDGAQMARRMERGWPAGSHAGPPRRRRC